MNALYVVANPSAGGGAFSRVEGVLLEAFVRAGWSVEVHQSTGQGDCERLAAQAPRGALVCAAGGDGTVSEVVNGLRRVGFRNALAVLPCGTGNDFALALGLPPDPGVAAGRIVESSPRRVDVGVVAWESAGAAGERVFCNVVGVGLDATAAKKASGLKRFIGTLAYRVAAIRTLALWRGMNTTVAFGGTEELSLPRALFVSVCNGPRSGGDFLLAPGATIDDGLLDICAVARTGFWRGIRLLPGVKHGRHVVEPEVVIRRNDRATVAVTPAQDLHIDGELLAERVLALNFELLAGALVVYAPDPGETVL